MTARPPATITAVAVRISLGILLIGFKCGLLSLMSLAPHFPFTGLWEPGVFMGYVLLMGLLELILTTPPAERASGSTTKPNPKTRIASAKGRVKPLARLLRLRYGR